MLPSTFSGRLFLLALPVLLVICLRSSWSPPFPFYALALIPLTLAKVRLLPTLALFLLMIWYSGQTDLFLYLLARTASAYLPMFSLWHWDHSYLFSRPSMFKFFRWSLRHSARLLLFWKAPTYLPLLFSSPIIWLSFCPHHSVLFSMFPFTSNSVADLAGTVFFLMCYQAAMGPRTVVSPGNDAADKLARRGALLASSAILWSLSRLISGIHSRLISDWRRTVSSKYFDTQVPSISTEELVLPRHARCVLSHLRYNGHSFLLCSYLSRIGRIENPSCSACGHSSQDIYHLVLHYPATDSLRRSLFGDSLSLYDLWSRPWRAARLLGPPSLGGGRVINNNNNKRS